MIGLNTRILAILFCGLLSIPGAHSTEHRSTNTLAELDTQQKTMVAIADVDGLAKLTHRAPANRVLTRDQFLAMMRNGQNAAEGFERTAESVTVTGNVGVVLGFEVFTPTAASELGKTYGVRTLKRRYTNIYVRENGKWLWLARHANVVQEQTKPAI